MMSKALLSTFLLFIVGLSAWSKEFRPALPGYTFKFPADHASHNDFKTEWWYYTGHLVAADGSKYGYELTFFRSATGLDKPPKASVWTVDDVYLAHFAVTDLSSKRFSHSSKLNRAGVAFAGADRQSYNVWNQNWRASLTSGNDHHLVAQNPDYKIDLLLSPQKPPVLHGTDGLSQKASCRGCASHYYSMTRLKTSGTISVRGKTMKVAGLTWMDHEFGSNQLTSEQVGWDWFSIQLEDNTELMLYVMRKQDGGLDKNSSGTYVVEDGRSQHLALKDYTVTPVGKWKSTDTLAVYPMDWQVVIPSLGLKLDVKAQMPEQELVKRSDSDVTYWEGACTVRGTKHGKPVCGEAYVEMTGYAEAFSKRI